MLASYISCPYIFALFFSSLKFGRYWLALVWLRCNALAASSFPPLLFSSCCSLVKHPSVCPSSSLLLFSTVGQVCLRLSKSRSTRRDGVRGVCGVVKGARQGGGQGRGGGSGRTTSEWCGVHC
ncbi:hypothetical protein BKA80DRAFT_279234 [Phyllosticta citrichinensis]